MGANQTMPWRRTILDLCGGTGSWSQFYADAGYDVIIVDPSSPVPGAILEDVRLYVPPSDVHGILAAPPCTHFSMSGARWWESKGEETLQDALSIVDACLRIVHATKPKWWALENPTGRLAKYLGRPRWQFQPYEFGDRWQKATCIWGDHNIPTKDPIPWPPEGQEGMERWMLGPYIFSPQPSVAQVEKAVDWGLVPADWRARYGERPSRAMLRSITAPKFARAFFEANP